GSAGPRRRPRWSRWSDGRWWSWRALLGIRAAEVVQDAVEAGHARFGGSAVPVDPLGQLPQQLGLEMHGAPLGVASAGDEPGRLEDREVLAHGLQGHVVGGGELADGGVTEGEAGDEVAPRGVAWGRRGPRRPWSGCRRPSLPFSTVRLRMTLRRTRPVVNLLVGNGS